MEVSVLPKTSNWDCEDPAEVRLALLNRAFVDSACIVLYMESVRGARSIFRMIFGMTERVLKTC
jgi:hypothetical protein